MTARNTHVSLNTREGKIMIRAIIGGGVFAVVIIAVGFNAPDWEFWVLILTLTLAFHWPKVS